MTGSSDGYPIDGADRAACTGADRLAGGTVALVERRACSLAAARFAAEFTMRDGRPLTVVLVTERPSAIATMASFAASGAGGAEAALAKAQDELELHVLSLLAADLAGFPIRWDFRVTAPSMVSGSCSGSGISVDGLPPAATVVVAGHRGVLCRRRMRLPKQARRGHVQGRLVIVECGTFPAPRSA